MVFVSIQTAVYATTSIADTGRATSVFNTGRQVVVHRRRGHRRHGDRGDASLRSAATQRQLPIGSARISAAFSPAG